MSIQVKRSAGKGLVWDLPLLFYAYRVQCTTRETPDTTSCRSICRQSLNITSSTVISFLGQTQIKRVTFNQHLSKQYNST